MRPPCGPLRDSREDLPSHHCQSDLDAGTRDKDELVGLDPLGGVEHEAGDEGADADLGGVRWGFDDVSLEPFITRVLPFGNDLHAVADLEGFGAAAGYGLFHDRR